MYSLSVHAQRLIWQLPTSTPTSLLMELICLPSSTYISLPAAQMFLKFVFFVPSPANLLPTLSKLSALQSPYP